MGKPQREVDPFRGELQTLRKALGNRIRELRKLREWSQEEFADNAHIHRTFAGSLERGEKNVSFHALVLIARCFEMTVSELFVGVENGASAASEITGPQKLGVKGRGDRGNMDRNRVLKEVAALERAARTLKEIALAEDKRPKTDAGQPKRRGRKQAAKN